MRVLGIDPSLASTGWALLSVDHHGPELLDNGTIKTSPKDTREGRLSDIHLTVARILETHTVERIAYERGMLYGVKGGQAALAVAEARGAILVAIAHRRDVVQLSPGTLKRAVTGKGNASKAEVQEAVARILRLDAVLGEDESDAAAAALAAGGWSVPSTVKARPKKPCTPKRKQA